MSDTNKYTAFVDFLKDELEIVEDSRHPAIAEIENHLPTISKLSLIAKNLTITSSEERCIALDVTADIRSLNKAIEEMRKKATEPARKIVQMINDSAKGLQEILSVAENDIKVKLAAFQASEAEKHKEAEESVRELSEKLGVDILIPTDAGGAKSSKASSYYKEVMSFEVVDPNLVPDEYWVLDEKLIQKHIDLGKKEIPGVNIFKEKKMFIRRK